jgi:hypothetical protein
MVQTEWLSASLGYLEYLDVNSDCAEHVDHAKPGAQC